MVDLCFQEEEFERYFELEEVKKQCSETEGKYLTPFQILQFGKP